MLYSCFYNCLGANTLCLYKLNICLHLSLSHNPGSRKYFLKRAELQLFQTLQVTCLSQWMTFSLHWEASVAMHKPMDVVELPYLQKEAMGQIHLCAVVWQPLCKYSMGAWFSFLPRSTSAMASILLWSTNQVSFCSLSLPKSLIKLLNRQKKKKKSIKTTVRGWEDDSVDSVCHVSARNCPEHT